MLCGANQQRANAFESWDQDLPLWWYALQSPFPPLVCSPVGPKFPWIFMAFFHENWKKKICLALFFQCLISQLEIHDNLTQKFSEFYGGPRGWWWSSMRFFKRKSALITWFLVSIFDGRQRKCILNSSIMQYIARNQLGMKIRARKFWWSIHFGKLITHAPNYEEIFKGKFQRFYIFLRNHALSVNQKTLHRTWQALTSFSLSHMPWSSS